MPIYEYRCKKCGKEFEVRQKFSDEPVKKCIHCNGQVEKLISASSFVLKGTGWYATDYSKKQSKPSAEAETKPVKKPDCSNCPSC